MNHSDRLGHCQDAGGGQGAELAFTYQGDALGKRSSRWRRASASNWCCFATSRTLASVDAVFDALRAKWGQLDFLVHAIAFSDKNELKDAMPIPRARTSRAPC